MEKLSYLVYVSSATWLLTEADLEQLLNDAREHNKQYEITGVLLYNDGTFFQYLEGAESNLSYIYDRIKNSRQHHEIIELIYDETAKRRFPDWYMGFFQPSKSELLNLANRDWWNTASDRTTLENYPPEGILLLDIFCDTSKRF